jgi:Phosphohistidine phosphatase SixA
MNESEMQPEIEPAMRSELEPEDREAAAEPQAGREQFVVLFRHGIAEARTGEEPDEDRALSDKGYKRMKKISRGLESVFPKIDALYSSPLLRAVQTAMWLRKRYGKKLDVQILEALAPDADPQAAIESLRGAGRRAVLVGHEPHLSALMKAMVGMPSQTPIELEKGGCYGIRLTPGEKATLEWILPAKVLEKLG